jgi:hypothetical protein
MIKILLEFLKFFLISLPLALLLYATISIIYKIKDYAKPQRMD